MVFGWTLQCFSFCNRPDCKFVCVASDIKSCFRTPEAVYKILGFEALAKGFEVMYTKIAELCLCVRSLLQESVISQRAESENEMSQLDTSRRRHKYVQRLFYGGAICCALSVLGWTILGESVASFLILVSALLSLVTGFAGAFLLHKCSGCGHNLGPVFMQDQAQRVRYCPYCGRDLSVDQSRAE